MYHLVKEAEGSTLGVLGAILYVSGNTMCYGTSAAYHIGRWSPRTEIVLQVSLSLEIWGGYELYI